MPYQSDTQPLCRYCGKPIAKYTETTFIQGRPTTEDALFSLADCQRRSSQKVVSLRYHGKFFNVNDKPTVSYYATWDGVSYKDEFFCTNACAMRLGYLMARAGHCTKRYCKAVEESWADTPSA